MTEIELKFRINKKDIKKITNILENIGYEFLGRKYEKTTMYDNNLEIMKKTDGRVRIRISGDKCEFSYKKPITRKGIKKEIEYEVNVSGHKNIEKILKRMEFQPTTSYERFRTTISKNGIKVTIDEFPFDNFIEIEGGEKEIVNLAKKLGLQMENNITKSCDTIFQEWRKKQGLIFKPHMLFDSYDK